MDILSQLEQSFNTKPVSIVEFAESAKFCNRKLYPRQKLLLKLFFLEDLTPEEDEILDYWIAGGYGGTEIEISPYIRERIAWLKANGYKHFREVVLVGGRRCSKGFITGLCVAKKIFDTLQLQDPGRFYGIDVDKEIVYAAIAAAQDQAKDQQYADISGMVKSCQTMQRHVHKVQELEFSLMTESDIREEARWKSQGKKIARDTSKIRGKALPANSRTIRGSAMMCIVFDEFAHFMQGESDQADSEVYAAAVPSVAQFGRDAMLFANSSPYSKVGTFYERYCVGMEVTDDGGPAAPNVLAIRLPSWALFEGWWEDPTYTGPKKCVTVSPDWDPDRKKPGTEEYFYTTDDRQAILIAREEERQDPGKFKVERRGHFAETIDAYLNADRVDEMFAGLPTPAFACPVCRQSMIAGVECPQHHKAGRRVFMPLKTNLADSTYVHRYKAHLDPSSTTAGFGFSLAHTEQLEVDGKVDHHVVFDIVKRWHPKDFPEGVIEWEPILNELMTYIDIFRPYELTMDQFNSAYPLQWLRREIRKRRINDVHIFEKTATSKGNWDRAEIFRTALYQGLVHAPFDTGDCEWASMELKYLQEIKTAQIPRVEKQEAGPVQTKDMADCIMVCVEDLIGNIISQVIRHELGTSPVQVGSQGGYPLGGPDRGGKGNSPMSRFYNQRQGEQAVFGAQAQREGRGRVNPARRAAGGRPIPRKLPGW